jgi:GNAT superfamily N-acetyltransferase
MRDGTTLRAGTREDAPEVLVLQRCCWVAEAIANDTLDIPPLHEDLGVVQDWVGTAWLLRHGPRLIGGVRATREGTGWHIGRLMVAPDRQGEGLGRRLLAHMEAVAPAGVERFALFTGRRSTRNLALYEAAGYRRVGEDDSVVRLEKPRPGRLEQAPVDWRSDDR